MVVSIRWLACLLVALVGCPTADPDPDPEPTEAPPIQLELPSSRLTWDEAGTISIDDIAGTQILVGATAEVWLDATDDGGRRLALSDPGVTLSHEVSDATGPQGDGTSLVVQGMFTAEELALTWTIGAWPDQDAYTVELAVRSLDGELLLAKASPLSVPSESDGGLFLGADPARHRILENGSFTVLDFVVEVRAGDTEGNPGWNAIVPGDFEGRSVSNWNHAVTDLDDGASWVAGMLSTNSSAPVMELGFDLGQTSRNDGRLGFSQFAAVAAYQPHPKSVGAEPFSSERYAILPVVEDPIEGLERYANMVKADQGIVLWTERGEDHRVPNGWNSWSGSGSTGGYGTGVDEAIILANLDVMADQLRDFGMDWFQLDDGYEPYYGDWWWREDRFPSGAKGLSDAIRARGLKPGLWMAPFTLNPDSETAQLHPDWMADTTTIGGVVGSDYEILDLTNPEVLDYIDGLMTTLTEEWGYDWLKMDFAYYALFGDGFTDANATREEAWRGALQVIRDRLGDDRFFMTIGVTGMNYGLVDSSRLTLDSMPIWEWQPDTGAFDVMNQQGLKPTVRSSGRRWYLQHRVWINHPDLIFFRSNPLDSTWPEVTFEEARAFASFIGLSGGIVKIGDRLVDLDPPAIDTLRRLMPVYPEAARPLDVFSREFPERWHLRVGESLDGAPGGFDVLGLFHWGWNVDLTTEPFSEIEDTTADRVHTVDPTLLAGDGPWLAREFWTGEFLGEIDAAIQIAVPSHDARIVVFREVLDRPQFLGWNRQISQGGTVLSGDEWDAAASTLTLTFEAGAGTAFAPFEYVIDLHVPAGFTAAGVTVAGAADVPATMEQTGPVLRARFSPTVTEELTLTATFE